MANVDETKNKGKRETVTVGAKDVATVDAKDVATVDAKEFTENPNAAPMATRGGGGRENQTRIAKMADAGYETVEKYAREAGTKGEAATVIDRDELDNLIGQRFVIVEKVVNQGDFGPFVSLTCVLKSDDVVVINAGGKALAKGGYSGIPGQLDGIDITPDRPHLVPNGLRRSDYEFEDMNQLGTPNSKTAQGNYGPGGGKLMPATTYYLDYADEKNTLFARLKAGTKKPRAGANGTTKPAA